MKAAATPAQQGQKQQPTSNQKKFFKVVIRKLPPTGYSKEDFVASLQSVCSSLEIPSNIFRFLHFIQGKVSRQRGPLGSAGFVAFEDEEVFKKLSRKCRQEFRSY